MGQRWKAWNYNVFKTRVFRQKSLKILRRPTNDFSLSIVRCLRKCERTRSAETTLVAFLDDRAFPWAFSPNKEKLRVSRNVIIAVSCFAKLHNVYIWLCTKLIDLELIFHSDDAVRSFRTQSLRSQKSMVSQRVAVSDGFSTNIHRIE